MKALPGDHRHKILISGDELVELKKQIYNMTEAFGLDRKIDTYQGTRPITLYRWDLECLTDLIDYALRKQSDYSDESAPEYQAFKRLGERLQQEYDAVYGHEKRSLPGKAEPPTKGVTKPVSLSTTGQKRATLSASTKSPKKQAIVYQLKITLAAQKRV